MLIKVCGLREEENLAQIISSYAPDFIGMIFYEKSLRYVGEDADELIVPEGISKVGVFVNASLDMIIAQHRIQNFDFVQLHGSESVGFVAILVEQILIKVIKVFSIADKINVEEMKPYEPYIAYFLFDTQTAAFGGSGRKFDWQVLEEYNLETPYILSGGLDIDQVQEIISFSQKQPKMAGVDINSKFETAPGLKDPEKVIQFIKKIRNN